MIKTSHSQMMKKKKKEEKKTAKVHLTIAVTHFVNYT